MRHTIYITKQIPSFVGNSTQTCATVSLLSRKVVNSWTSASFVTPNLRTPEWQQGTSWVRTLTAGLQQNGRKTQSRVKRFMLSRAPSQHTACPASTLVMEEYSISPTQQVKHRWQPLSTGPGPKRTPRLSPLSVYSMKCTDRPSNRMTRPISVCTPANTYREELFCSAARRKK